MKKAFSFFCIALLLSCGFTRTTLFAASTADRMNDSSQLAAVVARPGPNGEIMYVEEPAGVDGAFFGSRLAYWGATAVFVAAVATAIVLTQTDSGHAH